MMATLRHLQQTVQSIKEQFVGSEAERKKFLSAFYNHYIFKKIHLPSLIKFPAAKFRYQNIVLETRPETIDFWATLESYEPDLTHFLTTVTGEAKGTFVDVGAHIGRFSTLMAKQNWQVISFEPLKTNFLALEKNLQNNGLTGNAQIFNVGLGDQPSEKTIYFNKMELGEATVNQREGDSKDSIKILRFDDIAQDFSFRDLCIVKVDVEGFEEQVLSGMEEFVKREKPLFVIELWEEKSANLVKFLKSQGYKRLHIFWFVEEKHQQYIDKMYSMYNRHKLVYDYK